MRAPIPAVILLSAALAGGLAPTAAGGAEEAARELRFPREGFVVRLPAGWRVEQYRGPIVRLEGPEGRRLEVRWEGVLPAGGAATGEATRLLAPGSAPRRVVAASWSGGGPVPADLDAVFRSVEAAEFENPDVHADWSREWTLEPPAGWEPMRDAGRARWRSPDGAASLTVDAWADLPGEPPAAGDPDTWVARGIAGALAEGLGGEAIVAHEEPEVARTGIGGGEEARLAGLGVQTASQRERGEWGWVSVLVSARFRLVLASRRTDAPEGRAGLAALASFEPDTLEARRRGEAPQTGFDREDAPAVRFRRPATWRESAPTSRMRLVQYEVPGEPPAEVVVFFFGAGAGGGVEANLDRWRGQVHGGPEAARETLRPGPDVTVHLLDARGTYVGSGTGASGAPLHVPDSRMLAAVIECPGGPLYVRAVGPARTIDAAEKDLRAWLASFRRAP